MAKFIRQGRVQVQGLELEWHVSRWGGASTAYQNHRGLAISVVLEPGRSKELILEFPFKDYFFQAPKSQAAFEARLRACIEAAIDAGWRPQSRGKAFVHSVDQAAA